ncbi:hypothetical protein H310_02899 [Aphanomyces invadans]|uniref:Threonyl/alanyl tRNA synthetase SAD domain-containing protein n=1 Tax=Aphanomyces invadans TaxID=157072 RepID=A0A024ULJ6_9STRA|nr:hypothetical protein H310_02899 [Aphanomyces invadans]ETW06732.1 hypothetical protein H310_02899 [Aphanomyces invadans]|eukprot:XP_008864807.1 hypothetical protein H310_02899 [Aphanomyces invadans]
MAATAALGRLACQKNSFLKELSAKVVSCARLPKSNEFDVVFDDSVLFPEGGGQPGDIGTLYRSSDDISIPVTKTFTQDGKCVLRTNRELQAGDEVLMRVDWPRRLDHMQQHSAQHLISAIAKETLNLNTTTWSLGITRCNVEFDSPNVTPPQIGALESAVNDAIAAARPVTVHYANESSDIRVIVIDGMDQNPCCGTHVEHLGQLQAVKFLHTEVARGGTRVWFLAGHRVLSEFGVMLERERAATKLWSCPPEEHIDRLQKLLQQQSVAAKELKTTRLELAGLVASQLVVAAHAAVLHRDDADAAFLTAISAAFHAIEANKDKVLFLTGGSSTSEGCFLLSGPPAFVTSRGKAVAALLDGKGGGRPGMYQGKGKNMANVAAAQSLVLDTV